MAVIGYVRHYPGLGNEGLEAMRKWFAWYPVRVWTGEWVWCEYVIRRPLLSYTRPGKVFWFYYRIYPTMEEAIGDVS